MPSGREEESLERVREKVKGTRERGVKVEGNVHGASLQGKGQGKGGIGMENRRDRRAGKLKGDKE